MIPTGPFPSLFSADLSSWIDRLVALRVYMTFFRKNTTRWFGSDVGCRTKSFFLFFLFGQISFFLVTS